MTYQPHYDQGQQPASGPPSYGPPPEPQYGPPPGYPQPDAPPQGYPQSGGSQGYPQPDAPPQGYPQSGAPQGYPPPGAPQGYPQYGAPQGTPAPGGPQAYAPAAPEPKKKRKKWPFIVGGIALVTILGCVGMFTLFGLGAKKVAEDLDNNVKGNNAIEGTMNEPATDGKFQFTVTGMQCGVKQVGSADFGEKAQGQFCLVSVTVKNVGQSSEIFSDTSQKAYDKDNTEYSVDSAAAIDANKGTSTFLEDINPGNTVKGKLVFDVPAGTKLTSVVLHESVYTAGVRVALK